MITLEATSGTHASSLTLALHRVVHSLRPAAHRIEVGVVYYKQRVKLEQFNTTFTVRMSNLSRESMGNPDGFAFVVQNSRGILLSFFCSNSEHGRRPDHYPWSSPAPGNAFGSGAGGLGYGATPDYDDLGVRRSVAVEFDTFMVRVITLTLSSLCCSPKTCSTWPERGAGRPQRQPHLGPPFHQQ
jgi:hypothetical protein